MYKLAEAGAKGDRNALQRTMDLLISEAAAQGQHSQASRLSGLMNGEKPKRPRTPHSAAPAPRGLPEAVSELLFEREPRRRLDGMVLPSDVITDVREFLQEQEEAQRQALQESVQAREQVQGQALPDQQQHCKPGSQQHGLQR